MTEHEIKAKVGMDLDPLSQGLAQAKEIAKRGAEGIKDAFADVGKDLASVFGGAELLHQFEKVLDKVRQIERIGESTGLGAETWQKLTYQTHLAGIETDKVEMSMNKLSQIVGQAQQGEQSQIDTLERWGILIRGINGDNLSMNDILEQVSGKMADTESAFNRTAMAAELFGRGGAKMISMLQQWHESHGAGAAIFSKDDIESIKSANAQVEAMSNNLTIMIGRAMSGVGAIAQLFADMTVSSSTEMGAFQDEDMVRKLKQHAEYLAYLKAEAQAIIDRKQAEDDMRAGAEADASPSGLSEGGLQKLREAHKLEDEHNKNQLSAAEKLKQLEKERLDFFKERINPDDADAMADRELRMAKNQKEIDDAQTEFNKSKLEYQKKYNELVKEADNISLGGLQAALKEYAPSIQELAMSGNWQPDRRDFTPWKGQSPFANDAREMMRLQFDAKQSAMFGDTDRLMNDKQRIDQIRASLEAAGVLPENKEEKIEQHLASVKDNMAELVRKASTDGIKVQQAVTQ